MINSIASTTRMPINENIKSIVAFKAHVNNM